MNRCKPSPLTALPALHPLFIACALACAASASQACNATDTASLASCIANASSGDTVRLLNNITLTSHTGLITTNLTIDGQGFTLDGASTHRGFFVDSGTVTVQNITLANLRAKGGDGGAGSNRDGDHGPGGGGGMGAGGAVFVRSGSAVVLRDVTLSGSSAVGGAGGQARTAISNDTDPSPGAGGGMGGNGAGFPDHVWTSAGFGGGGTFDNGHKPVNFTATTPSPLFSAYWAVGGAGGGPAGGTGQYLPYLGGNTLIPGVDGGDHSGGGGGGGERTGSSASNGGFGGGGGSSSSGAAGSGGFGGGAGGTLEFRSGRAPAVGGFGGGGGGRSDVSAGTRASPGGFGGGEGGVGVIQRAGATAPPEQRGGGGGGAGMGGAIFVMDGASIRFEGNINLAGSSATGGLGGDGAGHGQAFGSGVFLQGSAASIGFNPAEGVVQRVADGIADQSGSGGTGANAASVGVTKTGAGTLVLTGNNTYSGGTRATAGVLAIDRGTALGSGTVTLGGAALLAQNSLTLSQGVALETGSAHGLAATDGQTLTIAGSLDVGDNAQLVVGGIGAAGTVRLDGDMVRPATGVGITVEQGRLEEGPGSAASGLLGASNSLWIARQGTLALNGTRAVSLQRLDGEGALDTGAGGTALSVAEGGFSGVIGGASRLDKTGAGTLVLTGNNTHTGGTTIAAGGVLQVGAGGSTSLIGTGSVLNNGTLLVWRDGMLILAQDISGTGQLLHAGPGQLNLTGVVRQDGGLQTAGGLLSLNGDISGGVEALNGGRVGGSGRVDSLTIRGGATLAPGNSIGSLVVAGELRLAAQSTLEIEVNPGSADQVNASGNVVIEGGAVRVLASPGAYARHTRYTIVSSGTALSGRFDSVSTDLAFLVPTLTYSARDVLLTLSSDLAPLYQSVADTPNQRAVAQALDLAAGTLGNAAINTPLQAMLARLDSSNAEQARATFETLGGSTHSAASQTADAVFRGFGQRLAERAGFGLGGMRNAAPSLRMRLTPSALPTSRTPTSHARGLAEARPAGGAVQGWAQASGSAASLPGDGNGPSSHHSASGIDLGQDAWVASDWWLGAALGVSQARWRARSASADGASGDLRTWTAGLYAHHHWGEERQWRLHVDASAGRQRFDTRREVNAITPGGVATSRHQGVAWALGAAIEHATPWASGELRQRVGLRHARLREDGFTETGAPMANLDVQARTLQSTTVQAGWQWVMETSIERSLALGIEASHRFGDSDARVTANWAGTSFTAAGTPLRRNALGLNLSASVPVSPRASLYATALAEWRGAGQNTVQLTTGLRLKF